MRIHRESQGNWDIKHSMVMCSGFNKDYKSSKPVKTFVMLCLLRIVNNCSLSLHLTKPELVKT